MSKMQRAEWVIAESIVEVGGAYLEPAARILSHSWDYAAAADLIGHARWRLHKLEAEIRERVEALAKDAS